MIILSLIREALSALWANKLRSTLTIIGMVFGITAVIAIVAAVEGMQDNMEDIFSSMGENTFMVTRFGIVTSWEEWEKKSKRKPFHIDLVDPILRSCDACEAVAAESYAGGSVKYESNKLGDVNIEGHTSNHIDIADLEVSYGRYISSDEVYRSKMVAFLGADIAEQLFGNDPAVGKEIRINGSKYYVVGVADKIGSLFGESQDEFIHLPISTVEKKFGKENVNLTIKAVSRERLSEAMDQTRVALRSFRHVPYDAEDDFDILTPDAILSFINDITFAFRVIVIALPFMSIVIGGIVIMNIMMVSVTERTREIGVRKSLGATRSNIRSQFLYESLALSVIGGLLGALFGLLAASAILGWMGIESAPTEFAIIVGVSISTMVGLFFGIYPAARAARLDPIKALSYE